MKFEIEHESLTLGSPLVQKIKYYSDGKGGSELNFNVSISKIGKIRDEWITTSGRDFDFSQDFTLEFELPEETKAGLYKISSICIIPDGHKPIELLDTSKKHKGAIHFIVTDSADPTPRVGSLDEYIDSCYQQQIAERNRPIFTPGAALLASPSRYTAYSFCVGGLIHNPQTIPGISIIPLGNGMQGRDYLDAVNGFTKAHLNLEIPDDKTNRDDFARKTPIFLVLFHNLMSTSSSDAFVFVEKYCASINVILGIIESYRPQLFATCLVNPSSDPQTKFYSFGFKGNLMSPFSPDSTGAKVEELLSKFERAPLCRLLVETYSEATSEINRDFQYFRYWSVVEQVAKNHVQRSSAPLSDFRGSPIIGTDGQSVNLQYALARVFQFLRNERYGQSHIQYKDAGSDVRIRIEANEAVQLDPGVEVFTLWEMLSAAYEVRNQVAHTGAFIPDETSVPRSRIATASRFYRSGTLLGFIEGAARVALKKVIAAS